MPHDALSSSFEEYIFREADLVCTQSVFAAEYAESAPKVYGTSRNYPLFFSSNSAISAVR
jgi:hypothetical protein